MHQIPEMLLEQFFGGESGQIFCGAVDVDQLIAVSDNRNRRGFGYKPEPFLLVPRGASLRQMLDH